MGSYMPKFDTEEEFEEWNLKQKEHIPFNEDGFPTFCNEEHFCETLEKIGFENVKQVNEHLIIADLKIRE